MAKEKKEIKIVIPERIQGMDCQLNGVHPIVAVNALNMLINVLAKQIVEEATKEVGDDPFLQSQWIDLKTKQLLGTKGDSNLGNI